MMLDNYDDDSPVREIPNGPHYMSPALRQVRLMQIARANEQVEAHGYTLASKEGEDRRKDRDADKERARVEKEKAKEDRRRRYEATKDLPPVLAAERLGTGVGYISRLRKEFEG